MARKKPQPLTEAEWSQVFALRCRTKQGQRISDEERALVDRAYRTDEKRYAALEPEVFNATVPFGSSARWRGKS